MVDSVHVKQRMTSINVSRAPDASSSNTFQVTVTPPASGMATGLSITVVLDRSGSMRVAAKPNGDENARLYSKTDLTKRGAEIIAKSLGENDLLTIIGYDSTASCILPTMAMTPKGQNAAMAAISRIRDGGCTALWDGLHMGLESAFGDHTQVVVLLTDGLPDPSPPLGEIEMFKRYLNGREIPLITIGFGYGMNSKFLTELAAVGGAFNRFVFIPDGTMVITSFVNLMAHLKTLVAPNCILRIKPVTANGDVQLPAPSGELLSIPIEAGGRQLSLGPLNYGQSRSVIFENCGNFNVLSCELRYVHNKKDVCVFGGLLTVESDVGVLDEVVHTAVISAVHKVTRIASVNFVGAQKLIADVAEEVEKALKAGVKCAGLLAELEDQLSEAIASKEAWTLWGAHYYRAWEDACMRKVRSNFKDKATASFGGPTFNGLIEKYNEVCNALPVIVPSIIEGGEVTGIPLMSATVFASHFNNASGGCFGPDGYVILKGGASKQVRDMVVGDVLDDGAVVKCVIKYANVETIKYGALDITPWHPVLLNGPDTIWEFPATRNPDGAGRQMNDYVYNFVLDSSHIIIISGVMCCTLGHGFKGDVIEHSFYGTQQVVDDLKAFPGWDTGLVMLTAANQLVSASGEIRYMPSLLI